MESYLLDKGFQPRNIVGGGFAEASEPGYKPGCRGFLPLVPRNSTSPMIDDLIIMRMMIEFRLVFGILLSLG